MMGRDNAAWEYAEAVTPAREEYVEEPEDAREMAWRMAREVVTRIALACEGDGRLCLMMLRRSAGHSLAEIAAELGVSKQDVHKRLAKVCRRHPEMSAYLRISAAWRSTPEIADAAAVGRRNQERMRRMSAWLKTS